MNAPIDHIGLALDPIEEIKAHFPLIARASDQARVIDWCLERMGNSVPVAAFMDLEDDARYWVENSTQAAVAAFFVEICARMKPKDFVGMDLADKNNAFKTIWNSMDAATQAKAMEYLEQNRKGQKAEPQDG